MNAKNTAGGGAAMGKAIRGGILTILILSVLLVTGCVTKKANKIPELVNLQQARETVKEYYTSGQYIEDVRTISHEGRTYIESELSSGKHDKPAIVFDIDDTLLNNHQIFMDMGYCFSVRSWRRWVNMAKIPAIEPMLELYKGIDEKVDVFIITGRNVLQKSQTIRNLKNSGYENWTNIFLKQKWDADVPALEYKAKIIKQLVEKDGYQIIANFGDQESDFGGIITGRNFKLPNYLYRTK